MGLPVIEWVRENARVSFDIFLQAFRGGDAAQTDERTLVTLLEPYLAERGDHGWARLRFADGEADIYGMDTLATGFMINHASGTAVWGVLVDIARKANLAIMAVGCSTAVTTKGGISDLPDELAPDSVVVTSGAELLRLIETA